MLQPRSTAAALAIGTMITSPSPAALTACVAAGLDCVFLDTEHSSVDRTAVAWMARGLVAAGVTPLVRIPSRHPHHACMAIDDGALGIIAPYIETVDQVRTLVGATKLRPIQGERLTSRLAGEAFADPLHDYVSRRSSDKFLFIQIESVVAVQRIDSLLIDGVDGIIFGPHDLSCNAGVPEDYQNAVFVDLLRQSIDACVRKDKYVGLPWWHDLGDPQQYIEMGVDLIFYSNEMNLFRRGLNEGVRSLRSSGR